MLLNRTRFLRIIHQAHKAEVHVQLLRAVEERHPGFAGDEVHFCLLIAAQHHNVLHDACGRLPRDARQLERVAMQVDGMNIVAGISHAQAVVFPLVQMKRRRGHHLRVGVGHAVDGPLIESVARGVLFLEEHVENFVWSGCVEGRSPNPGASSST